MLKLKYLGKRKRGFSLRIHWGKHTSATYLESNKENTHIIDGLLELFQICSTTNRTPEDIKQLKRYVGKITGKRVMFPKGCIFPELIYDLIFCDGENSFDVLYVAPNNKEKK